MCFSDCHDSTCACLIVMLILMNAFIIPVLTWVCVKCFNIDVCIYSTSSSSFLFLFCFFVSSGLFVMLILMQACIVLALFLIVK